jgi:hypothetical protein
MRKVFVLPVQGSSPIIMVIQREINLWVSLEEKKISFHF